MSAPKTAQNKAAPTRVPAQSLKPAVTPQRKARRASKTEQRKRIIKNMHDARVGNITFYSHIDLMCRTAAQRVAIESSDLRFQEGTVKQIRLFLEADAVKACLFAAKVNEFKNRSTLSLPSWKKGLDLMALARSAIAPKDHLNWIELFFQDRKARAAKREDARQRKVLRDAAGASA